jgi:hypothetical protein
MVYAVSTHNNLDCLWLKLLYSNTFLSPADFQIIIQVLQTCTPILDFNLKTILQLPHHLAFLRLNLTIPNFCTAHLLSESLTFATSR